MDSLSRTSDAVERLLIRETLERYLASLDRQDWDAIASCFTADSISHYNNEPQALHGGKGVADFLHGMKEYNATSHGMSHVQILLEAENAFAHSVVIATMHAGEHGVGRVRIRAIDYQDNLAKIDGEWKITKREHKPTLQYDALSQTMILFSK